MTKAVQLRRGTTTEHLIFTGLLGEVTVDTDKKTLVVHDQETAGGFPLARDDLSNVSNTILSTRGLALSDMSNVSTEDIANRGIAKTDLSNLTASADATELNKGVLQLATLAEIQTGTNTTKAITPAGLASMTGENANMPMGYIYGFNLSIGTDSEHDIIISKGSAKSEDNTASLILNTSLTKQIDSTWVAGNELGGMPAPLVVQPNTTYYVFAITNPATGAIDSGFDTDIDATNLLNVTTNYTKYRRIGAVQTDANSNLIPFKMVGSGNDIQVLYTSPFQDLYQTSGHPSSWTALQLTVPTGIEIKPFVRVRSDHTNMYGSTTHLKSPLITSDIGNVSMWVDEARAESQTINDGSMLTNTNGEVMYKVVLENASNSPSIWINTLGYSDFR